MTQSGTIIRLVVPRGFGFIQPAHGGPDLFFHAKHCQLPFEQELLHRVVEFETMATAKGPAAINVREV
jgi:cold shock CspA family protein